MERESQGNPCGHREDDDDDDDRLIFFTDNILYFFCLKSINPAG